MSTSNVCFFFTYNGKCASGDQCSFTHAIEDALPTNVSEPTSRASLRGAELNGDTGIACSPQTESNTKQKTCIFWRKGSCKRGNSCGYVHAYVQNEKSSGISSARSGSMISNAPSDESEERDEEDSARKEQEIELEDDAFSNDNDLQPNQIVPESEMEKEDGKLPDVELGVEDGPFLDQLEHEGDRSLDTVIPDNHDASQDSPSSEVLFNDQDVLGTQTAIDGYEALLDAQPANNNYTDIDGQGHQGTQGGNQTLEEQSIGQTPHWTEYADPQANPFVAFCKFFARGRCNHEASCTYRHALTVQEYFLLFRLEPLMWSSYVQVPYENNQALAPSLPPSSSLGPCKFYPLGKCRNGDKCPFDHIADSGPEPNEQNQNGWEDNNEGSHEQNSRADGKQLCRYYLRDGSCRRGDDCYFSHELKDGDSWDNVPASDWNQDWGTNAEESAAAWNADAENQDEKAASWNADAENRDEKAEENAAACNVDAENQDKKTENNDNTEASEGDSNRQPDSRDEEKKCTDDWDDNEWGKSKGYQQQSGSRRNDSQRRIVCRNYLRGSCSWTNCKFPHEVDESTNVNMNNNRARDNWANDDWTKGDWTKDDWANQWSTSGNSSAWDAPSQDIVKDVSSPESQPDLRSDDTAHEQDGAKGNSTCDGQNTLDDHDTEAGHDQNHSSYAYADSWNHRASTMSKSPCRFFEQGHCLKGSSCTFLHVRSDDLSDGGGRETSPSAPNSSLTKHETQNVESQVKENGVVFYNADIIAERSIDNCTVSFGAGCQVQYTLTTSDPNHIILRNLPSKDFLNELPIEGLRKALVGPPTEPESAILEFDTQLQTLRALRVLEDYKLPRSTLSVRLHTEQMADLEDAGPNCEVKVTWPAPCRMAWARYKSVPHAKEDAARLDGQIFGGRKVEAKYLRPVKGQASMFAVQISNLPPDITDVSVKQRCQECQFVNLTKPTYVSSPVECIKGLLSQHGQLVTFDAPDSPSSEETMIAFVKFDNVRAATAAAEALHDFKADFLGDKGFLKVESIHHSQYKMQPEQFRFIQGDLEKLHDTYRQECSIMVVRTDENVTIHTHAPIKDGPMFAKLLVSLNSLVYGDVLRQDGTIVWDDYFNLASSVKVIDAINAENAKDYNVLVVPDHRTQRIHILGEQMNRLRARESVLKILKKVRTAWNEVPFDRIFVRWYLEQGQSQIQSDPDIGQNRVSLDLTVPKLIVRGETKVLNKVKDHISNAVAIHRDYLDQISGDICHICLNRPISPIALPCQHQYCENCLKTLLAATVENIHIPLRCIAKTDGNLQCDEYLPYVAMRDLLPMADEERLSRAYFLAYVRSNMEGLFFCPSPRCTAIHRYRIGGVLFHCSTCGVDICSSCRTRHHLGATCDQWREIASL